MAARCAVLGMGKLGSAFARRVVRSGHNCVVWNRTRAKAEAVVATVNNGNHHASGEAAEVESDPAGIKAGVCVAADTPHEAVSMLAPNSLVVMILSNTAAVANTLESGDLRQALDGHTLCNLTTGSPDDGRETARSIAAWRESGQANVGLIDGAYCGGPDKVEKGIGSLFVSADESVEASVRPQGQEIVEDWQGVLSCAGEVGWFHIRMFLTSF